ncbi:LPXTG cell wall anchor domain-containing protein [Clavibacter tessellarius]|uniref:LPXTG cell wall anchor domain-containing protein n=1 Tax=Clavibacter tessellarius TaxID=31965 RepID=UPI0032451CED
MEGTLIPAITTVRPRARVAALLSATAILGVVLAGPGASSAQAATAPAPFDQATIDHVYASDATYDFVPMLDAFPALKSGRPDIMKLNDDMTVQINQTAPKAQSDRAIVDQYADMSVSMSDGLGVRLGAIYKAARDAGQLPKTAALLNKENGLVGRGGSTGPAKNHYANPRPYVAFPERLQYRDKPGGNAWAGHDGSYPSGHTSQAFWQGVSLATMLPEARPADPRPRVRRRQQPHRDGRALPDRRDGRAHDGAEDRPAALGRPRVPRPLRPGRDGAAAGARGRLRRDARGVRRRGHPVPPDRPGARGLPPAADVRLPARGPGRPADDRARRRRVAPPLEPPRPHRRPAPPGARPHRHRLRRAARPRHGRQLGAHRPRGRDDREDHDRGRRHGLPRGRRDRGSVARAGRLVRPADPGATTAGSATARPAARGAAHAATLARTGSDLAPGALAAALGLLVAGGGLVLVRRRRSARG